MKTLASTTTCLLLSVATPGLASGADADPGIGPAAFGSRTTSSSAHQSPGDGGRKVPWALELKAVSGTGAATAIPTVAAASAEPATPGSFWPRASGPAHAGPLAHLPETEPIELAVFGPCGCIWPSPCLFPFPFPFPWPAEPIFDPLPIPGTWPL